MEERTKRFRRQMDFLLELDKVKLIGRQTYLADGSRLENDAEHSWHAAVMAAVLAEYFPKADLAKTIIMMLLHDVVEIYAGDTYCYDTVGYQDKDAREKAAAEKIYGLLPEDQKEQMMALWQEFEAGQTEEAKFCAILDRVQPTMLNHAQGGRSWVEHGIHKEQVEKRNAATFQGPDVIAAYMREIIDTAYETGVLK